MAQNNAINSINLTGLTYSAGGIPYSTATQILTLAGTTMVNQVLLSGNLAAPAWSIATYPSTTTANQLLYSSATNTITGLTSVANSVLATNGSSIPGFTTTLPSAVQVAVGSLGSGTSASSTTFWRGDGVWASPSGSGTVNSGTINQLAWYAATGTAVSGLATANSGVLVTDSSGVPSISTGGQIPGTTTNNNASAGNIGEIVSSVIPGPSFTSITSNITTNITSISLTAGQWDVFGNASFLNGAGGNTLSQMQAWTSTTSANLTQDFALSTGFTSSLALYVLYQISVPYNFYKLSTTTTIYLSTKVVFATGTGTISGAIYAVRRR